MGFYQRLLDTKTNFQVLAMRLRGLSLSIENNENLFSRENIQLK
jgi:hypothetical protein